MSLPALVNQWHLCCFGASSLCRFPAWSPRLFIRLCLFLISTGWRLISPDRYIRSRRRRREGTWFLSEGDYARAHTCRAAGQCQYDMGDENSGGIVHGFVFRFETSYKKRYMMRIIYCSAYIERCVIKLVHGENSTLLCQAVA